MTAPCQNVCHPWATKADFCSPCHSNDSIDDVTAIKWLGLASDILFELSGQQFPGSCQDIVRPCSARAYNDGPINRYSYYGSTGLSVGSLGFLGVLGRGFAACGCHVGDLCGCSSLSEIKLPGYPVTSVDDIKLGYADNPDWPGTADLNSALYRVDDWSKLVRLPNLDGSRHAWPCCQDLLMPAGAADTFEVTYTYGQPPPPFGVTAAAELACELLKGCSPETFKDCKLPPRVTSVIRQGTAMNANDILQFFPEGLTGLGGSIDLFIQTYNPHRRRGRATITSADDLPRARRAGT